MKNPLAVEPRQCAKIEGQEKSNPNESTMDVPVSSHCRFAGIGDDGIARLLQRVNFARDLNQRYRASSGAVPRAFAGGSLRAAAPEVLFTRTLS